MAELMRRWEEATRRDFENGTVGESSELYAELEALGADPEELDRKTVEIIEEVFGWWEV